MTWRLSAHRRQSASRQVSRLRRPGIGVFHRIQVERHASALITGQQGQVVAASAGTKLGKVSGIIRFGAGRWRSTVQPNTSFKRTVTGRPPLALISFWAKAVLPAPAA